jgi:hypothetical protein
MERSMTDYALVFFCSAILAAFSPSDPPPEPERPKEGVIAQAPSIRPNVGLDVLVDEGLLTRTLDGIALKYALTEAIKPKLESVEPGQPFSGGVPKLCIADIKVVDVVSFTKSADTFGSVVSNVRYTTRLTNIEPWAAAAFPDPDFVSQLAGDVSETSSDMLLTDKGWQLPNELQR